MAMTALLVAGCGSDSGTNVVSDGAADGPGLTDEDSPSSEAPFETVRFEGELEVRCGTLVFPDRVVDLRLYPEFTDDLGDFVSDGFREEFELQWQEGLNEVTLHEIERTEDRILLMGDAPDSNGAGFTEIGFEKENDEWRISRWGGCRPQVTVDGFGISELRLDPSDEPDASSTALTLLVTERECASGELPVGRAIAPVVVESDTSVQVVVLIEESRGDVDCPGNPSFPLVVDLSRPLGQRSILDIAFEPPNELVWPIPLGPSKLSLVVEGEPPAQGNANSFTWSGALPGGLMLEPEGWADFSGPIQSWSPADQPITITGFVTSCGSTGCGEECEAGDCESLERLGAECVAEYVPTEAQDSTITITYDGTACSVAQVLTSLD